jgi:protein TonB
MPRDLFGDVVDPSVKFATGKWYTVPLSFVAHTSVIGVLIVAPLVATGALPMPDSGPMVIDLAPPPLPQPPPPKRAAPVNPQQANPHAAPIVAPAEISPEIDMPSGFESDDADFGLDDVFSIQGSDSVVPPPPPAAEVRADKPVPVGGVIRAPQRVHYVAPEYPAIARAARVRGLVIVQAVIDTSGRVQEARVLRSDSPLLEEAAIAAVRQWTYTPTLLNGVPVSVIMTVSINFQMQ